MMLPEELAIAMALFEAEAVEEASGLLFCHECQRSLDRERSGYSTCYACGASMCATCSTCICDAAAQA